MDTTGSIPFMIIVVRYLDTEGGAAYTILGVTRVESGRSMGIYLFRKDGFMNELLWKIQRG